MPKHSITLVRDGIGNISPNRIGTDALKALSAIPGVEAVEITQESDEQAELSYNWTGTDKFWETNEHLSRFGLRRAE